MPLCVSVHNAHSTLCTLGTMTMLIFIDEIIILCVFSGCGFLATRWVNDEIVLYNAHTHDNMV